MLDFSRMTDFLTEMAGNVLQGASAEPQGMTELLADVVLDPSTLAGLSEAEIMTLLNEHGVDVSEFAPRELSNLVADLGLGDGLAAPEGFFQENSIEAQNDFA